MLVFCDIPVGDAGEVCCCRCRGGDAPPHTSIAELSEQIDSALRTVPDAGVLLSGVDSLDHGELGDLVKHAARAGASRIALRTSGRALADAATARQLVRSGVRVVEVTFLGSNAQAHDALATTPGAFDTAAAGIAHVRAAADALGIRVAVRGRVRVCRHNLQDLPATVMRLAEMGVASISLACDPTLDHRRSVDWVLAACDTGTVNRVWVSVSGVGDGVLGDRSLHATDPITICEVPA